MKTLEAIKIYNQIEDEIKSNHPELSAFKRADKINDLLVLRYNEDIADEIIDLVFEHEFTPAILLKDRSK